MMKAALMSRDPRAIARVWADKQMNKLKGMVELYPEVITSAQMVAECDLAQVEVIFSTWGMLPLTEEELAASLPNLKAVFYAAGTVQYFARPFLNRGIRVYSAWLANAVPVVQYTVAQILLATNGYFTVQPLTRTDRKAAQALWTKYPGNYGVKIGLLGCGAIGSRVAEMLKPMDFEVLAFDPFLSAEKAEALGVRKAELDEIFASCAVVSNHLANLPATVGIMKREHFLSLQPYSTFINTGRGPQLDEKDLYDALVADPTRTALLDVMTEEHDSDENPLNALPNCFITPHIAGSGGLEVQRMADYMLDALESYTGGTECGYEVSMKMLETMA